MGELRAETGFSTLGMLGLGAGIGAWVEKAKDAQTEFAGAQKSIASVLSTTLQFSKGTSEIERYRRSFKLAKDVVEEAEETAGRFNMSLEDVSGVYRSLSLSAGQFGLSQKQVSALMVETSATAKRFGVSGEYAAGTIARALKTGSVRGVDEFSLSLARAMGNMHKLGQAARFDHIQKALRGSIMIADEMQPGHRGQHRPGPDRGNGRLPRRDRAALQADRDLDLRLGEAHQGGPRERALADRRLRREARHGVQRPKDVSGFIKDH